MRKDPLIESRAIRSIIKLKKREKKPVFNYKEKSTARLPL